MPDRTYFVYILSNRNRTLYVGVTNDLTRRLAEHKSRQFRGFAQKYFVTRLVYFEAFADARCAIVREKQLKRWLRSKKIGLIHSLNPDWRDLSCENNPNRRFGKFPFPTNSLHPNLRRALP